MAIEYGVLTADALEAETVLSVRRYLRRMGHGIPSLDIKPDPEIAEFAENAADAELLEWADAQYTPLAVDFTIVPRAEPGASATNLADALGSLA